MKSVVDQAVLWVYCFLAVLFVPADVPFVMGSLLSLLCACGNCLAGKGWQKRGYVFAFLVLSVVCPRLLFFTPLMMYVIFRERSYGLAVFLGVLCLVNHGAAETETVCLVMIGIVIAFVLESQTRQYTVLEEKYRRTRDDSMERNLLLKEKNQSILKNQDYEIYTATLRERNRIAREIHDNVGHMLSRSILMVGAMKAVCGDGAILEPMEQLEGTLNAAMNSVRKSVHDLHDESVNLKEVLEGLVGEFSFCTAGLDYDMGYDVPREIRYSFIAIVKEALHNVTKHSNATQVRIVAREHPGLYQLIIEDNGVAKTDTPGLRDQGAAKEAGAGRDGIWDMPEDADAKGIGIQNMRDRIDAFGGHFEIRSGKGWRIYITVPKQAKL